MADFSRFSTDQQNRIQVVAAVIRRNGQVLMTSRPPDKPPAGMEFPGGKAEKEESLADALIRELHEELAVNVTPGRILYKTVTDRIVLWFIEADMPPDAVPIPREGQSVRWVDITPVPPEDILPNDRKFWDFLNSNAIFTGRSAL